MSAKEYCKIHPPYALYNVYAHELLYLHGIEHGVNDCAYISDVYGTKVTYHKLRIKYRNDRAYFVFYNANIYIDAFIKIEGNIVDDD